jgi:predicted phosphoribosyltransferase
MNLRRSFREIRPTKGEYFRGRMPRNRPWRIVLVAGIGLAIGVAAGLALLVVYQGDSSPISMRVMRFLTFNGIDL